MSFDVGTVLDRAAAYLTPPSRWQQFDFRDWQTGECCAAGAIAYTAVPWDVHGDPLDPSTGNAELAALSREAATFFAEYLVDYQGANRATFGDDEAQPGELDVIETIAGYNDDPARTQTEVVAALHAAAAEWRERAAARELRTGAAA